MSYLEVLLYSIFICGKVQMAFKTRPTITENMVKQIHNDMASIPGAYLFSFFLQTTQHFQCYVHPNQIFLQKYFQITQKRLNLSKYCFGKMQKTKLIKTKPCYHKRYFLNKLFTSFPYTKYEKKNPAT